MTMAGDNDGDCDWAITPAKAFMEATSVERAADNTSSSSSSEPTKMVNVTYDGCTSSFMFDFLLFISSLSSGRPGVV